MKFQMVNIFFHTFCSVRDYGMLPIMPCNQFSRSRCHNEASQNRMLNGIKMPVSKMPAFHSNTYGFFKKKIHQGKLKSLYDFLFSNTYFISPEFSGKKYFYRIITFYNNLSIMQGSFTCLRNLHVITPGLIGTPHLRQKLVPK